jgi:hypothetical protein
MPRPEGYAEIPAHKDSIQQARETKQSLGLTWNEFLETAARQLDNDHGSD